MVASDYTTCFPDLDNGGVVDAPFVFPVGLEDNVHALHVGC